MYTIYYSFINHKAILSNLFFKILYSRNWGTFSNFHKIWNILVAQQSFSILESNSETYFTYSMKRIERQLTL